MHSNAVGVRQVVVDADDMTGDDRGTIWGSVGAYHRSAAGVGMGREHPRQVRRVGCGRRGGGGHGLGRLVQVLVVGSVHGLAIPVRDPLRRNGVADVVQGLEHVRGNLVGAPTEPLTAALPAPYSSSVSPRAGIRSASPKPASVAALTNFDSGERNTG